MTSQSGTKNNNLVTYDLKDLGQSGKHQQSLGQIFSIIEKAKADQMGDEEMKCAADDQVLPCSQDLIDAVHNEGIIVYRRDDEEKR